MLSQGHTQRQADARANSPEYYTDTFFVPPPARWQYLRDELHHNVGDGLNKALGALEEHNPALEGVIQHIDLLAQWTSPASWTRSCATGWLGGRA